MLVGLCFNERKLKIQIVMNTKSTGTEKKQEYSNNKLNRSQTLLYLLFF